MYFKQLSHFFKVLSKYQFGFRNSFSIQHCLLAMLEKWKRSLDNGKDFAILLADLSKDFDCFDHEFLIAKISAYWFSLTVSAKLFHDYLSNRKQTTKTKTSYIGWHEVLIGAPQRSILGLLSF